MRTLALAVAAAAAVTLPGPGAHAMNIPIKDWPTGFTCFGGTTKSAVPGTDYVFKMMAGPLVPVTDGGDVVSDVAVTCTLEVVPETYPPLTLTVVGQSAGGVVYGPPQAAAIPTGERFTVRSCSHLTWTDAGGAPRTGGSCHTQTYGS